MEIAEKELPPLVEAEAKRLSKMRQTCCSLLRARGYNLSDTTASLTPNQVKETCLAEGRDADGKPQYTLDRRQLTLLKVAKLDDPTDEMFVFFDSNAKLSVKNVSEYAGIMMQGGAPEAELGAAAGGVLRVKGIIVYQNKTALTDSAVAKWRVNGVGLELFREDELMFDVTEHKLVPKHTVLNSEQKASLLAKYKLKESQLPRIQLSDPVARFYGLVKGNVVKIERKSETAGKYITYRVCI